MALTDLTRISTSGIATGSTIDAPILRKDVSFRGSQVGVTSALFDSSENELNLKDNVKLTFGNATNGDLRIYHDTSNGSYVREAGPGALRIQGDAGVWIQSASNNQDRIVTNHNGDVQLFYSGNKKLNTTSHGAVVTGILTATGFSGPLSNASGISTFYDLRVTNNLTVEGTTSTLDTTLIGVDRVEVGANSNSIVGVAVTQSGTADLVRLYDGASQVVTVDDTGNVGIGSAIPASLLNLASSNPLIRLTDTDNGGYSSIGGEGGNLYLYTNTSTRDFIFRGSQEVARLTGDGTLGIGTHTPDRMLHIKGTGNAIVKMEANYSGSVTGIEGVLTASGANRYVTGVYGKVVNTSGSESNVASIRLWNQQASPTTSDSPGYITFNTTNDGASTATEKLRITSSGNVLLNGGSLKIDGTGEFAVFESDTSLGFNNSAQISLDFASNIARVRSTASGSGTNRPLALCIGSSQKLHISTGGDVGVGNDSPNCRLAVKDTAEHTAYGNVTPSVGDCMLQLYNNPPNETANDHATMQFGVNGGSHNRVNTISAVAESAGNRKLAFTFCTDEAGSRTEKLRITGDGNVGIGTNNPGATLTVQSDSSNTSLTGHNYLASQSGIILQNRTISSGHFTAYTGNVRSSGGYTQSGSLAFEATGSGTTPNIHITQRTGSGVQSKRLTVDTSGHILPGASGTQNLGSTTLEWGNVYIADSKNIFFGNEQDAEIYHNGSSGLYMNNSTGNTYIRSGGGQVLIRPSNSYDAIVAKTNEVELYYNQQNHSTPKLKTSATGITVDGEVAATQDYPLSRPTLDLNFAAQKKLDPRITYQRTGPASFTDKFGKVVLVGDNAPRFDHDPDTGECKGLLIEESRTNIAPYTDLSEYGGYNFTSTANDAVAPDGTTTATKIEHGGSGTSYLDHINTSISAQNAGNYTYSVWLKAPDDQPDGYYGCRIAVLHSTGGNVEPTVSLNKTWTRYSVTKNFGASDGGNLRVHLVMFRASPGGTYDGKVIPSYVWAWGAQIEQGAFPTSYIPTAGATRGKDLVEITGEEFSEFYNRTEGSFVSEIMLKPSFPVTGYASVVMSLSDSSYDNRVTLSSSTGSAAFNADVTIGGTQNRAVIGSYTSGSHSIKAAMAYKQADSAGSLNGAAAVTTSPSPGTLPLLTRADIGKDHGNFNPLNGHIKRIMYYSKRLSNNQLRTLTS